jgi:glycosyltransferase involved in cell wall biosynthesis
MMNIIFIGKFFPSNLLKTIKIDSKGKMGLSNHNFELSIINGLCQQTDIDLKCVSCPGVYSYPHNNRNLFTKSESYDYKSTHIESAGFCNLRGVKEWDSAVSTARVLAKTAESFSGSVVNLIINTPDARLFNAVKIAEKKTSKRFTKTVIIPDIPALVTAMDKQNLIKKILLDKIDRQVMESLSECNGLVLLTEAMMDFVAKPAKHIVMEGLVDVDSMDRTDVEAITEKKVILYTGTLREIFGVKNLVKAFRMIPDQDAELWICGGGDSEQFIKEAASQDSRIRFFGLVDSKTALEFQHKAIILVNPRTSKGEFTKYSFPSKTMEYLLAGRSVVAYKLPGIPDEYYQYVYTPSNESVEAFAECISEVLNLEPKARDARAAAGRNFVIEKKNSKVQMSRVIDLIKTY